MTSEYEDVHDVEQFLAHFGVKGMKWGQRRPVGSDGLVKGGKSEKPKATAKRVKKETKADAKWAKNATSLKSQVAVYNKTAAMMNAEGLGKVNSNPKFKGTKPLLSKDIRLRQAYLDTVSATANKYAQKAHKELHGDSPNGRVEVKYTYSSSHGVKASVSTPGQVKHLTAPSGMVVKVQDGYITKIGTAKLPAEQ